jgi:hypothetical protein
METSKVTRNENISPFTVGERTLTGTGENNIETLQNTVSELKAIINV